ncbi:MAG TPA: ATP-binding protein [Brevefilum fermentans]|jgi:MinD superfamily P-loop ATPase|nr:ATP-binding protein [Brevefilum fermentans]
MKIAIASGKGGTGKTMVATSLAASLAPNYRVHLVDCDVEAPNTHLFLKPEVHASSSAVVNIPQIDPAICNLCGVCVEVCQFHALAMIAEQILVFPQLCHGCGSCTHACPMKAISEFPKEVGKLNQGKTDACIKNDFGVMTISEAMPTPIIYQLKALESGPSDVTLLDAPPGASCAVVATIYDADYVLLVTESTPFGLHDLEKALGIVSKIGSPAGVIINRDGIGDGQVEAYLAQTPYPILMKIPYHVKIAEGLGSGKLLVDIFPSLRVDFLNLFKQISESISTCKGEPC